MIKTTFSAAEILSQLDDCAAEFAFPMLDNGYIYPADVRLHAFANEEKWAIVIEHLGYDYRSGDHDGMTDCVHYFGNCLRREPGMANEDFLTFTADGPDDLTFQEEINWHLKSPRGSIYIRDELVEYDVTPDALNKKGIKQVEDHPGGADLLRSLLPEHRHLLLATDKEVRHQIAQELPLLLNLDEWYHPDLAADEMPSGNETFQLIAQVLCSGDPCQYKPTMKPNTHWSNWPAGGTL